MKRKLKFLSFILSILLSILCFSVQPVYAYVLPDTDVLTDLTKDETFNTGDYPSIDDNFSLEVIQIAESTDKKLYIYTYNPSHSVMNIEAEYVTFFDEYTESGKNLEAKARRYKLKLISVSGVFDKYEIEDYQVSDEGKRYYNIVSLHVPYNSDIHEGKELVNGYTDYVAYEVKQQWESKWFNDELVYERMDFEYKDLYMNVDVVYNGELDFNEGLTVGNFAGIFNKGRSHFLVFNCDEYIIRHIYDADITYRLEKQHTSWVMFSEEETTITISDIINDTLYDTDTASYDGGGLFSREYTWSRIMPVHDLVYNGKTQKGFIENFTEQKVTFSDTLLTEIEKGQWVFAFTETNYNYISGDGYYSYDKYRAIEVGVTRLHFVDYRNKEYNLGVISDLTSSDGIADGYGNGLDLDFFEDWFTKIMTVIGLIALLVVIAFCFPIISTIISILFTILNIVIKTLLKIIALPFKLIGKIGKKNKS